MEILLFGSTGMLGNYVFNVLKSYYSVTCINRDDFDIENDDWDILEGIVRRNAGSCIINCSGIIPQKAGKDDYRKFIRVNTLFPHKLNEYANMYDCEFIHITTDCVFDGSEGNYTKDSKHTATDIYGVSKSLGEPSDATIIRTSMIGEEISGKKSLLEWVKNNRGGSVNGYINHHWNGVTCLTLAHIIKQIIDEELFWIGVKHIFSAETVSKCELCCYINEIYGLDIEIIPCKAEKEKIMTLSGKHKFISNIYSQIEEQKLFGIN